MKYESRCPWSSASSNRRCRFCNGALPYQDIATSVTIIRHLFIIGRFCAYWFQAGSLFDDSDHVRIFVFELCKYRSHENQNQAYYIILQLLYTVIILSLLLLLLHYYELLFMLCYVMLYYIIMKNSISRPI